MSVSVEDLSEEIRSHIPGPEEIVVQYVAGYLLDLDDAAEEEDVLEIAQLILESAIPSTSKDASKSQAQVEKLIKKLGELLEEPLRKRAEKNRAGNTNGLVRLDKVMDLSKAATMSSTIALGEGVDLESINKGK